MAHNIAVHRESFEKKILTWLQMGYCVSTNAGSLLHDELTDKIVAVTEDFVVNRGVKKLTVSMILKELGVTNRVFYNRFRNIDDVLNVVYKKVVIKMRESIHFSPCNEQEYFAYLENLVISVLSDTYDLKKNFSQYTFEHDSLSKDNCDWWIGKIKKIILYGVSQGYLKEDIDADNMSYFAWCFCRGCNADSVTRNISKEKAVACMKEGFSYFLEGAKRK